MSPPQPEAPQSSERRPAPASASSFTRLAAARTALASGRIDEARRLLQEAQLQLVFRPVDLAGADSTSAGRGAADVARALEALSANDTPSSRRYIDIALDDLSGNATSVPLQESSKRATGYAPAYPAR